MKQFLISEEERINILSKHKALMKEQVQGTQAPPSSDEVLRKAVNAGCLRNGNLVKSTVDPTKIIYKAKSNNGDDIEYYSDMTYKFTKNGQTGKWNCQQAGLMKEQVQKTQTPLEILRKAVKGGCLRNGQLLTSNVDPNKVVYRAKTDSGLDIDFFGDMTYKFRVSGKTGRWSMCQRAIDMEKNEANAAALAAETKKDNDAKIESLKKQNYKTKDELVKGGVDLNTLDKSYDMVTIGQVNLYRLKGDATKIVQNTGTKQFNDEQTAFIKKYENQGYIVPGVSKTYDRTTLGRMTPVTAAELDPSGIAADLFPNGLTLYYDPNSQSGVKSDKSLVADILKNQTVDREACRKNVEDYYKAFKMASLDPATLYKVKAVVQACKNQYYGDWGILGGGKKLDNYLDILSGVKDGGPTSYGENSIYRLK